LAMSVFSSVGHLEPGGLLYFLGPYSQVYTLLIIMTTEYTCSNRPLRSHPRLQLVISSNKFGMLSALAIELDEPDRAATKLVL